MIVEIFFKKNHCNTGFKPADRCTSRPASTNEGERLPEAAAEINAENNGKLSKRAIYWGKRNLSKSGHSSGQFGDSSVTVR